jgi:hypothetical protein
MDVCGVLEVINLGAARKITFGLPRLASEVIDGKGFHSGRRGGGGIFRGAPKTRETIK